jgi:replication-associated recombination protein RarA
MTKLIGPSGQLLDAMFAKIERLDPSKDVLKAMFIGEPGIGKSEIAMAMALRLANEQRLAVERVNGADVTAETVRSWRQSFACSSLFADWRPLVIEEVDKLSPQAQVLMLTFLDTLQPGRAVLCTSNLEAKDLTPRFQTRFQLWQVAPPKDSEVKALLIERGLPPAVAQQIAVSSVGNVRAALLDAESWKDVHAAA